MSESETNPLAPSEDRDRRIRDRAYLMWEAEGRPEGRDLDYWERARELEAMSEHPHAGEIPVDVPDVVEEAAIQENLGEFPGRFTDQGERAQTPKAKKRGRG